MTGRWVQVIPSDEAAPSEVGQPCIAIDTQHPRLAFRADLVRAAAALLREAAGVDLEIRGELTVNGQRFVFGSEHGALVITP